LASGDLSEALWEENIFYVQLFVVCNYKPSCGAVVAFEVFEVV
jgi:hypothetical protein